MLTFEQKMAILDTYPELERKQVSLGRVNYHYEESQHDKKTVAYHLHPNGNGFIYAGLLKGYSVDGKGFVNIRDYEEDALRELITASIRSLSAGAPDAPDKSVKPTVTAKTTDVGQVWVDAEGAKLTLKLEDDVWMVYSGVNLEMAFETREEAEEYLVEEGFTAK